MNRPFDSFCLEVECFKKRQAFFRCDPQDIHVKEGHCIKSIHPVTFLPLFRALPARTSIGGTSLNVFGGIDDSINKAIIQISNYLRKNIFQRLQDEARTIADSQSVTIDNFTKSMQEGDYDSLELFLKGESGSALVTLNERKIKKSLESLKLKIDKVKQEVLECLHHEYVDKKEEITRNNKKEKQKQDNKQLNPNQLMLHLYKGVTAHQDSERQQPQGLEIFKKKSTNNNIKIEEQVDEEDKEPEDKNDQSSNLKKTKLIHKIPRNIHHRPQHTYGYNSISEISSHEVVIKDVKFSVSILKTLRDHYPSLTAIHIQDPKFITKACLKKLFNDLPKISTISFNCSFDYRTLEAIPRERWQEMNRVCVKWDLGLLHQDYFMQKYFPCRNGPLELISRKGINMVEEQLKKVYRNSHLWLDKHHQLVNLSLSTFNFDKITSLQVEKNLLKPGTLKKLRHLRWLRVNGEKENDKSKDIKFSSTTSDNFADIQLASIIDNNLSLENVMLNNMGSWQQYKGKISHFHLFDYTYKSLAQLPQLRVFSLIYEQEIPIQVSAIELQRLKHLQYLNIHNVVFSTESQEEKHAAVSLLSSFQHLKHLSLYNCPTITSQQINELPSNTLNQIQFLNLELTQVDGSCLGILSLMPKLLHLGLGQTFIKGSDLVEMLEKFFLNHNRNHPLQHLNMKKKVFKWKIKALSLAKKENDDIPQGSPQEPQEPQEPHEPLMVKREEEHRQQEQRTPQPPMLYRDEDLMKLYKQQDSELKGISPREKRQTQIYKDLVTQDDLHKMGSYLPALQYLNLSNHYQLSNADLRSFSSLQILVKDNLVPWRGRGDPSLKVICQEQPSPTNH